jgi:hypothetical protein
MKTDPEKTELALALLYLARSARDFSDFAELAQMNSKYPLEEYQLRLYYDRAWALFVEQAKEAALREDLADAAIAEEARQSIEAGEELIPHEQVRPDMDEILVYVLSLVLEVASWKGAAVSANLLYPLVPAGYDHVVQAVFNHMRYRLEPVGWEVSQKPSRKKSLVRTYHVVS